MPDHKLTLSSLSMVSLAKRAWTIHSLPYEQALTLRKTDMMDRQQTRSWTKRVTVIGQWLGRVVQDIALGLDALRRVQYDRPWERAEGGTAERLNLTNEQPREADRGPRRRLVAIDGCAR